MSRGSSSLGGGGFSGGFSSGGGSHGYHGSSNNGLLSGLIIGSLLSRRSGGSSNGSSGGAGPQYKRVRNQKATIIACAIMLAIAVMFIVLGVVFRFDRVYAQTTATATDVEKVGIYYYTTYDFSLNGKNYSTDSKVGWTKLEHMEGYTVPYDRPDIEANYLNKDYQIFYKISDPYTIYEVEAKADMPSTNAIYIFLAVFFGFITIITYAVGIYKLELDPAYVDEQKRQQEVKEMEGKRRCPYCGTIMDAKESKCSNCGASQK